MSGEDEVRSNEEEIYEVSWFTAYWFVTNSFNRNLLLNNTGQDHLNGWKICSKTYGTWVIETPPEHCDSLPYANDHEKQLPYDAPRCFVSTHGLCGKEQIVDLHDSGASSTIMDVMQPKISVTEYCAGHKDFSSNYELQVELLNEQLKSLSKYSHERVVGGRNGTKWHKVNHVFDHYGTGVRFIRFYHSSVNEEELDRLDSVGHYGSKMTGATIKLSLPFEDAIHRMQTM